MPTANAPLGLAMIICDAVHRDPFTAKRTLLGVFSNLMLDSFPTTFETLTVHIAITECLGVNELEFRISRVDEQNSTLRSNRFTVISSDPIESVEFDLTYKDVLIPSAGRYAFELLLEGGSILSRSIHFSEME